MKKTEGSWKEIQPKTLLFSLKGLILVSTIACFSPPANSGDEWVMHLVALMDKELRHKVDRDDTRSLAKRTLIFSSVALKGQTSISTPSVAWDVIVQR
ncbi:MAG: hypothetical protein KME45_23885 [Stenomitos rutilans HA7619-LM2]|nr:hypothetical protein [Stenomitos rutilans HA7619-LM2]